MLLDEASVTGTANVVMAAALAAGTTTIYNAACEPYLQQLCKMINRMGGKIGGVGSNLLTIEGVPSLGGTEHRCLPDMIEIGSFIGMAAMTQSEITIKDCAYDELGVIPNVFQRLGIQMERRGEDLYIPAQDHYEIDTFIDGSLLTVADAPWPGFTPDLLSIVLVTATQARGSVLVHQKMFESRLFFVDKLIDMGAQIILCDPHRATVIGLDRKVKPSWRDHDLTRHPGGRQLADCGTQRRGQEHHPQHRPNRQGIPAHRRAFAFIGSQHRSRLTTFNLPSMFNQRPEKSPASCGKLAQ